MWGPWMSGELNCFFYCDFGWTTNATKRFYKGYILANLLMKAVAICRQVALKPYSPSLLVFQRWVPTMHTTLFFCQHCLCMIYVISYSIVLPVSMTLHDSLMSKNIKGHQTILNGTKWYQLMQILVLNSLNQLKSYISPCPCLSPLFLSGNFGPAEQMLSFGIQQAEEWTHQEVQCHRLGAKPNPQLK